MDKIFVIEMLKVKKMESESKYLNLITIIIVSFLIILGTNLIVKQESKENSSSVEIANPSAVYCEKLGYKYIIENTPEGQRGICIFNGGKCDAWEFLKGTCGLEHTFCAKHGGTTEIIRSERCKFTYTCILCRIDNKECTEWEWVTGSCL